MISINTKFNFLLLAGLLTIVCTNFSDGKIAKDDPVYKQATGKSYDQLLASGDYYSTDEMFGDNWSAADPEWEDYEKRTPSAEGRAPSRSKDDVKFVLYSQAIRQGMQLGLNPETIRHAGWDPNNEVKVIIHGYRANSQHRMPQGVKNAYIDAKVQANVLIVAWDRLAGGLYWDAAGSTYFVAGVVVEFLEFLQNYGFVKDLDKVHLIGYSLGAHLAGDIGMIFNTRGKTIGRITGLDPAGPGYIASSKRLDSSDAKFVDVIHTNAITYSTPLALGTSLSSGHADFYPNGGSQQPGCGNFLPFIGQLMAGCHHFKSVEYFMSSISDKYKYTACACDSWDKYISNGCPCEPTFIMGEHCNKGARGYFFLRM